MMILAIDPGNEESAYVVWDGEKIVEHAKCSNEMFRSRFPGLVRACDCCIIEQIASYGMAVGAETFETCVWTGRFMELFGPTRCERVKRLAVKLHLCHDSKAKDGNIRQAIIDRFGGKEKSIGKKATQGPLFGISRDEWSALAVALTWWDLNVGNALAVESARYEDTRDAAKRLGVI